MLFLLLSAFLTLTTIQPSLATLTPYPHSSELEEKNKVLTTLFLHTYGPDNPFIELTTTVSWCIKTAEKATGHRGTDDDQKAVTTSTILQNFLHRFDYTISDLLQAFIKGEPKETLLKDLSSLCNEVTNYLNTNPLPFSPVTRSADGGAPKKMVFFDPAIIGSFGQLILKGVISLWFLYVVAQIYKYITAENHEALDDIKEAHLAVYENIGEIRKSINPYIPESYRQNIKLEVPKVETHWLNFWARHKQWRARKKIVKAIELQADGIAKTIPDTRKNKKLIKLWTESLQELSKEFRQNNA